MLVTPGLGHAGYSWIRSCWLFLDWVLLVIPRLGHGILSCRLFLDWVRDWVLPVLPGLGPAGYSWVGFCWLFLDWAIDWVLPVVPGLGPGLGPAGNS